MQATDSLSANVEDLVPWLHLATVAGVPRHVAAALVRAHETAPAVFDAVRGGTAHNVSGALAAILRAPFPRPLYALAEATLAWAQLPGNHLLALTDPRYPPQLGEIADPPLLLHAQGDVDLLRGDAIGVVGARNATLQGVANAERFSRALADAGFTIVSGLALGIDRAAHHGGLAGTGRTVAVVGTGIDIVYPAANIALAARIRAAGCIVSEFTLGTPPLPQYFPIRNRIISGLARGVLVVEAAKKSGSLITARLAGEQGRDVFAIPGSIHATLAKGCHQLIRQGALLVDSADDILEAFGRRPSSDAVGNKVWKDTCSDAWNDACNEDVMIAELTHAARALLDALTHDPVPADELATRLHLDPADTQASLLALELAGVVERLPGGAFQRLKR